MTSYYNITGCAKPIYAFPCVKNRELFSTIEYPYINPNYDLQRETHDWERSREVPRLLTPQLRRYHYDTRLEKSFPCCNVEDCPVSVSKQRQLYNYNQSMKAIDYPCLYDYEAGYDSFELQLR